MSTNLDAAVVEVKRSFDGWRLLVDGKPFFIKGVCFAPSKVSPNEIQQVLSQADEQPVNKTGLSVRLLKN